MTPEMTARAGPLAQMSPNIRSGSKSGPWLMFPVSLPSTEIYKERRRLEIFQRRRSLGNSVEGLTYVDKMSTSLRRQAFGLRAELFVQNCNMIEGNGFFEADKTICVECVYRNRRMLGRERPRYAFLICYNNVGKGLELQCGSHGEIG
jgi:hypothetical protein